MQNYNPDNDDRKLIETLNAENESLNSENAAQMESIVSVYYQSYTGKNELAKERARLNATENALTRTKKDLDGLRIRNGELCDSIREKCETIGGQEIAITKLKAKGRARTVIIVVMAFLLAAAVFSSVVLLRWDLGYRSIIRDLRDTSHVVPVMSDMIPDSVRDTYEDVFHEKW